MNSEIASLRREEAFKEAGNGGADLVIYDLLASWPPSNFQKQEAIRKIIIHYGDILSLEQARSIVGAVIAQEALRRINAERYRARHSQGKMLRSRKIRRRA